MKSTGVQFWNSPNTGATDSTGLSVIGGGQRTNIGSFQDLNNVSYLWAAPNNGSDLLTYRSLYYDRGSVYSGINEDKKTGYSVRCMKDIIQGGPTSTSDLNQHIKVSQIFPNPSQGSFYLYIQTDLQSSQPALIKITDMMGKTVASFSARNDRGIINHLYNGSSLKNGIYTLQYVIGTVTKSMKLIIQK
jgi:hypothetical protein